MEIFVKRIPPHCKERDLKRFFKARLATFGITNFVCEKLGNKTCAKLIFLEMDNGRRFLARYGVSYDQRRPTEQLSMNGNYIDMSLSRTDQGLFNQSYRLELVL
jgi:hypothetical protein